VLHHVPKEARWTPHLQVHDYVTAVKVEAGGAPLRTVDYAYKSLTTDMLDSWKAQTLKLSYIGHARLKPSGTKSATLSPTHLRGGPWMRLVQHRTMLTARLVRALTGHAPVAAYGQRFGFNESDACACGLGSETINHVIHRCRAYKRPMRWFHPGARGDVSSLVKFLRLNTTAFCFSDRADIVDPEEGTLVSEGKARGAPPDPRSRAKRKIRREKPGGASVPAWSDSAVSSSGGAPPGGASSSVGRHVTSVTRTRLRMVPVGEPWARVFEGRKTTRFSDGLVQTSLFTWFGPRG